MTAGKAWQHTALAAYCYGNGRKRVNGIRTQSNVITCFCARDAPCIHNLGFLCTKFNHVFRKATTLPQDILSVASGARGILDFSLPQHLEAQDTLQALRSLAELDSPIDLESFHREIDAIVMEFAERNPRL